MFRSVFPDQRISRPLGGRRCGRLGNRPDYGVTASGEPLRRPRRTVFWGAAAVGSLQARGVIVHDSPHSENGSGRLMEDSAIDATCTAHHMTARAHNALCMRTPTFMFSPAVPLKLQLPHHHRRHLHGSPPLHPSILPLTCLPFLAPASAPPPPIACCLALVLKCPQPPTSAPSNSSRPN